MMKSKVLFLVSSGILFLGSHQLSHGQTLFLDDFSDGTDSKWTHVDFSGRAVYDASSGSYHIKSGGPARAPIAHALADDTDGEEFWNGILSFAVSPDTLNTAAAATFRNNLDELSAYAAQLITDPFGQSAVLTRFDNGVPQFPSGILDLGWAPGHVYEFEVTFDGPNISMTVWEQGNERPAAPQIEVVDATYSTGQIGLYASQTPFLPTGEYGAVFDDVRFEALPSVGLQPGDADQNLDFDQLDLVQVQIAAMYLTGATATWGEGDWNGAPGGELGNPPAGNGLFDQIDVIAALAAGTYLTGPYAAVRTNGQLSDGQTSVVYNAGTGEMSVHAPAGTELTSINIDSASGIFTGETAQNLSGSFDNDADGNIFKATFGGSFGSLSFGNVAQTGLSEEFVLGDLSVVGSLAGGGDLGNVDLVYVPEPTSVLLLAIGLVIGLTRIRHATH